MTEATQARVEGTLDPFVGKVEVTQKNPYSMCHVEIDGLHVGTGTRASCTALRDELRASRRKARLVHGLFANATLSGPAEAAQEKGQNENE